MEKKAKAQMNWLDWFFGLLQFVLGFLFGAIVTGIFTVYVVIPQALKRKEVRELTLLFREAKDYLRKILEHQENNKN